MLKYKQVMYLLMTNIGCPKNGRDDQQYVMPDYNSIRKKIKKIVNYFSDQLETLI